jgi:hypothetical protein
MRQFIKNFASTILISLTTFLVGCSGCDSRAGDSVTGTGVGVLSPNGNITGIGTGTAISQTQGTQTGTVTNSQVVIKMADKTDNIVCTSSTGVVTVYTPSQWQSGANLSGSTTCVDTPVSQAPTPPDGGGGPTKDAASKAKNSF